MVIDCHCHVWADGWVPDAFWDGVARIGVSTMRAMGVEISQQDVKSSILPPLWDPTGEILVKEMDEAGIEKTVIFPVDWGLAVGEAKLSIEDINRRYAELAARHPDRLIAFFGIDPRRDGAAALFEAAVRASGMKGLKLHPAGGFYPNDRVVYPLYERAVELGVPVVVHTGPIVQPLKSKYTQPIHLDDVLVDFPDLTVIAAHMGHGWWPEAANLASTKPNLFLDISAWELRALKDYASFARTLRAVIDEAGSDRLLFGTDGPGFRNLVPPREYVRMVRDLLTRAPEGISFTADEIGAILHRNAQRVLGLEAAAATPGAAS